MEGEEASGARVPQGLLVWRLPDISEDHLTYFFENERKTGGGALKSIKLDKRRHKAVIFFEEPGMEEKVLNKYQEEGSFVLEGKHIKVALHSENPTDAGEEAEEETEETPCRTVEVKNFAADTSDNTFELYLENPEEGGGPIQDLQINREEDCLLVTFQDPAVAARFVERKHTLGGRSLDVKLCTHPPKPAPVEMYDDRLLLSAVAEGTSQDCLAFFLEAKTGIVPREFIKGKEPGVYMVMFDEEPDIAQLQEDCKTVQVEGAWLQVEGVPVSRTVLVTSLNPTTSQDAVELYFEAARRSGGGEVESFTMVPGENACLVTYREPQVAIRVSEKQDHKLDGANLQVSLYHVCLDVSQQQDTGKYETAPVYKDRLVIAGVGENTTRDCLTYFLQATTDCKPKEITHGKEPGSYLVVFEKLPDIRKLDKVCQTHRLEGAQLNVSQVPVSRTVRVKNMSKSTTQDSLELYFESSRSCGGEVESAELSSDEGTGLVTFVEPEVALRVCAKRDHTLDGARLEVCLHHECLGPGGDSSPEDFKLTAPVELRNLDKYKLMYLRGTTDLLQALEKELQEAYVQVGWPEKKTGTTVRLECTLTPEVQGARKILYSWGNNALAIFQRYMEDLITMKKKEILQSMWSMVEERLTSISSPDRETVTLFVEKDNASLIMAGMAGPVKAIYAEVEKLIQAIERQLEEEKAVIEETIDKLKPHQLQLLRAIKFPNMAMSKYPGLQVQFTDRGINFKGQHKLVKSAQFEMYEKVSGAASQKLTHFSPGQLAMLRNREMKLYLVEKFRADQVVGVWDVQDKNLMIHACTDKEAVAAADIVKQSLLEFKQELEQEAQAVLKSPEWRHLIMQLHASCLGVLKVEEAADYSYVQITSNDLVFHAAKETIVNFLRENAIHGEVQLKSVGDVQFVDYGTDSDYTVLDNISETRSEMDFEPEEPEMSAMLRIWDLPSTVDDDSLLFYFENRRKKGGGPIEKIELNKQRREAIITFQDADAVERVLQNAPHLLKDKVIKVERHNPAVAGALEEEEEGPEEEEGEEKGSQRTLYITGIPTSVTEEMVELYLENKKKGGGAIEDHQYDIQKGTVFVTFESEEVAERFLNREHRLGGKVLTVKLWVPPKPIPMYKDRLLLSGVKETTTLASLTNFLEAKIDCKPKEFIWGDEPGVCIVVFKGNPDIGKLQEVCGKRKLEGAMLTVSPVPLSCTVKVKNLRSTTTKDSLELYFENPRRSHGGDVVNIELLPDESAGLVTFLEPEVALRVWAKKGHTLYGARLEVCLHHECLGLGGGSSPAFW